jgi:hypothetical protein
MPPIRKILIKRSPLIQEHIHLSITKKQNLADNLPPNLKLLLRVSILRLKAGNELGALLPELDLNPIDIDLPQTIHNQTPTPTLLHWRSLLAG